MRKPHFFLLAAACLWLFTETAPGQSRVTLWDPMSNSRAEALVTPSFLRIDRGISVETYTRDTKFDALGYWGFSNASLATNQIVRWPANNRGGIEIGSYRFGRVVFRPARMQIVGSGLPIWGGGSNDWRPTTYLGVRVNYHPDGGGVIVSVDPDSLADDLGVRTGDYLYRINGLVFYNNRDFREALSRSTATIQLTVFRAGREVNLQANLVGRPIPWNTTPAWTPSQGLGIVGWGDTVQGGVVVQVVQRGSVAELMGIQAGDRIMRINRINVSTTAQFAQALNRLPNGVEVDLMRYGRGLTLRYP